MATETINTTTTVPKGWQVLARLLSALETATMTAASNAELHAPLKQHRRLRLRHALVALPALWRPTRRSTASKNLQLLRLVPVASLFQAAYPGEVKLCTGWVAGTDCVDVSKLTWIEPKDVKGKCQPGCFHLNGQSSCDTSYAETIFDHPKQDQYVGDVWTCKTSGDGKSCVGTFKGLPACPQTAPPTPPPTPPAPPPCIGRFACAMAANVKKYGEQELAVAASGASCKSLSGSLTEPYPGEVKLRTGWVAGSDCVDVSKLTCFFCFLFLLTTPGMPVVALLPLRRLS